jgi:hypothetical protein
MIIAKLVGGLGNQMFIYAAARALAQRHGVVLKLDLSVYERDHRRKVGLSAFSLNLEVAAPTEVANITENAVAPPSDAWWQQGRVIEPHFHYTPDFWRIGPNAYLSGYWQSERYFNTVTDLIRSEFQPNIEPRQQNREWLDRILRCNAVAMHVRRGDYVTSPIVNQVHGVLPPSYYASAFRKIAERETGLEFFVFTDDPSWARTSIRSDVPTHIIEGNVDAPAEDLRLMSSCRHHIIANSSFSWWGAWLCRNSNKIVCAPRRWFAASANDTRDLIPADWNVL